MSLMESLGELAGQSTTLRVRSINTARTLDERNIRRESIRVTHSFDTSVYEGTVHLLAGYLEFKMSRLSVV